MADSSERGVFIKIICNICSQPLFKRSPRTLRCKHSFCLECLEALTKETAIKGELHCPVCNIPAGVTKGKVSDLPVNVFLTKIRKYQSCNRCPSTEFAGYCLNCHIIFCGACKSKHTRKRLCSDHVVLEVCAAETCPEHKVGITKFCAKCEIYLCQHCVHVGHEKYIMGMERGLKEAQKAEEEILACLENLDHTKRGLKRAAAKINEEFQALDEHSSNLKQWVEQERKKMKSSMEQKQQQLGDILAGVEACERSIGETRCEMSNMRREGAILQNSKLFTLGRIIFLGVAENDTVMASKRITQSRITSVKFKPNFNIGTIGQLTLSIVQS